jgi:AsmA protein
MEKSGAVMTRARKIAILIAVILLVLACAPLIVRLAVPPNGFKPLLASAVRSCLGLTLVIEGDLSFSFFPKLALTAGRAALQNPPGFDGNLASFESLRLEASLAGLLKKKLAVTAVVLSRPTVELIRTADGKTNWEPLLARAAAEPAAPAQAAPPATPNAAPDLAALSIQSFSLRNAAVSFDDKLLGRRLAVTEATLATGPIRVGEPVRLDGTLDFSATEPLVNGRTSFVATLRLAPEKSRLTVSGLAARTRIHHDLLPKDGLEASLTGRFDHDWGKAQTAFSLTLAEPGGAILAGMGKLTRQGRDLSVQSECSLTGANPKSLAARLGRPLPASRDPLALTRLEGEASLFYGPDTAELRTKRLLLDQTRLRLEISRTGGDKPVLTVNLGADALDLDGYAPTGRDATPPAPAATPGDAQAPTYFTPLAGLPRIQASADFGRLKVAGLAVSDLSVKAQSEDGVLRLNPVRGVLYGGKLRGEAKADLTGSAPVLGLRGEVSGLALEPLLRDLYGQARLTGTANASADLTAKGAWSKDILASLGGAAKFSLRGGVIRGVSLSPELLRSPETLFGLLHQPDVQKSTRYDSIAGSFRIDHGLAQTNDFAASAPPNSATAHGTYDLAKNNLDMRVAAQALGLTLPVKLTGPLDHPFFALDPAGAPAALAGTIIQTPQNAGKAVLDALGGLLGGKKK